MNSKPLLLIVALTLAPAITTASSVYKWTDDNGITHFADRQPAGTRAQSINIRTLKPVNDRTPGRRSPQEQLDDLKTSQGKKAESTRARAQQDAQKKQRNANCTTAKRNLNVLRSNGRIRVDDDGEQRYLSPEEIAVQQQNFEVMAHENCGSQNPQDS